MDEKSASLDRAEITRPRSHTMPALHSTGEGEDVVVPTRQRSNAIFEAPSKVEEKDAFKEKALVKKAHKPLEPIQKNDAREPLSSAKAAPREVQQFIKEGSSFLAGNIFKKAGVSGIAVPQGRKRRPRTQEQEAFLKSLQDKYKRPEHEAMDAIAVQKVEGKEEHSFSAMSKKAPKEVRQAMMTATGHMTSGILKRAGVSMMSVTMKTPRSQRPFTAKEQAFLKSLQEKYKEPEAKQSQALQLLGDSKDSHSSERKQAPAEVRNFISQASGILTDGILKNAGISRMMAPVSPVAPGRIAPGIGASGTTAPGMMGYAGTVPGANTDPRSVGMQGINNTMENAHQPLQNQQQIQTSQLPDTRAGQMPDTPLMSEPLQSAGSMSHQQQSQLDSGDCSPSVMDID